MGYFSDKTEGYEQCPAYIAYKTFFDAYFLERDYEKTLSFMEDDFHSFGTGGDEVACNKAEFIDLFKAELQVLKEPIYYRNEFIYGKEVVENVWNIFSGIEIKLPDAEAGSDKYSTRFTGCFKIMEDGFVVTSTHLSEASFVTDEKEFLPIKYGSKSLSIDKEKTEKIIFDIMSKAIPGGVVSGYVADDFPLYFVNEQYLHLLGYSTYDEYYEASNGMGITHIHPEDREMVNHEVKYGYNENHQHTIEYRIRHKDGHYIDVYDIGKKMIMPDGKDVIICVLYDMTEEIKLKKILLQESNYDVLTELYNRRGLDKQLDKLFSEPDKLKNSAIIVIDADGLKEINDTYGHDKGDIYLKKIATIINNYGIGGCVASRLGGDEFVLFLYEYESEEELLRTIETLKYIQDHSTVSLDSNVSVQLRFSMGYSLTKGISDYKNKLKEADEKMYKNKSERKKK